jgi:hypothetical protein
MVCLIICVRPTKCSQAEIVVADERDWISDVFRLGVLAIQVWLELLSPRSRPLNNLAT